MALRKSLLLPLDNLLSVVREFLNPHVSRSGLDRCLRRHGVGNLRALKPALPRPAYGAFKAYEPGYVHVDVKYLLQMADEDRLLWPVPWHQGRSDLPVRSTMVGGVRVNLAWLVELDVTTARP